MEGKERTRPGGPGILLLPGAMENEVRHDMGNHWTPAADEQRFRDDVTTGDKWVKRIAMRLDLMQLWAVHVPRVEVRGQFADRRAFRDHGDLFLNGHRIEVRSLGFAFNGAATFPRRTVQVELVNAIESKRNAVAYLFVSRATGAVVGLVGSDLRKLSRDDGVWNARRGVARDWMVADASTLLDWDGVVNYLTDRCQDPTDWQTKPGGTHATD